MTADREEVLRMSGRVVALLLLAATVSRAGQAPRGVKAIGRPCRFMEDVTRYDPDRRADKLLPPAILHTPVPWRGTQGAEVASVC